MALFEANEGRLTLGGSGDGDDGIVLARGGGISLKKVSWPVFYTLTGALCLWVFVYISGIFPYLGTASDNKTHGVGWSTSTPAMNLGTGTMFLFKGQTAFFDYASHSDSGELILDVKPVATLGYSDRVQRISGAKTGKAEFEIEQSGFYNFEHDTGVAGTNARTHYSVSWGAR